MAIDPKKLRKMINDDILREAINSSEFSDIELCLKELAKRKKITETGLLFDFYRRIIELASGTSTQPSDDNDNLPRRTHTGIYFPDTVVILRGDDGEPLPDNTIRHKRSGLNLAGYHVGIEGPSKNERRDLLTNYMRAQLHPRIIEIFGDAYGEPDSLKRVLKMANVIANVCKLRKRRKDADNFIKSISDWDSDLSFLKEYFFIPLNQGLDPRPWPDTDI